jgi:hypothetical protein
MLSDSVPSEVSTYSFSFGMPTTTVLGSIVFQFCGSPVFADPCVAPPGLDVSAAALSAQSGNTAFTIDNADTTPNKLVITRPPLTGSVINSTYDFDNITNPSTAGQTVYVRIATYTSTDGTGAINDNGAVAYAAAIRLNIGAFVPPYISSCVGITVAINCSSATADSIDLGNLSANQANSGQSQFSTGTNSPTGYAVYALGTTMTSGNNVIAALASPSASFAGVNQFGINLRANSSPVSGQDPAGAGVATPTPNYDIPNFFMFNNGDMIASSNFPSNYNRMTVSYLVNVSSADPSGVYSTTITYLASAQF